MSRWPKIIDRQNSLEERMFAAVLICAVPYFIVAIINGILSGATAFNTTIAFILLGIVIATIYYGIKRPYSSSTVFIFNSLVTIGFIAFWPSSSGVIGGAGYIFMTLSIVLLLTSKGKGILFTALCLLVFLTMVQMGLISPSGKLTYFGVLTDFIANLLIISVMMLIFKALFDQKERALRAQIEQLSNLNEEMLRKNEAVEKKQEEILAIRNNLEEIIEKRTQTYRERNEQIIEYAFINAHLLRAPLTNIMALTRLPELPSNSYKTLDQQVEELDSIIRKIGGILAVAAEVDTPSDGENNRTYD